MVIIFIIINDVSFIFFFFDRSVYIFVVLHFVDDFLLISVVSI